MAKKKNEGLARVRYVKDEEHTGPRGETEAYCVETYDAEFGWALEAAYYFSKSELWPEAKEPNYVPFEIVPHIFRLMHLGYHVHFCKAGEN